MISIAEFQDPFGLVKQCGGYYKCPKSPCGKRLGPVVGYATTYEEGKQWVGDEYINFAKVEKQAIALDFVADKLVCTLLAREDISGELTDNVVFCGAPEGGKALAVAISQMLKKKRAQYIFPEKKVIALKTKISREVSELVFDRHVPEKGDRCWIVEDICNNFGTTAKLIALIEKYGAHVLGILCFLNRSPEFDRLFVPVIGDGLPCWPVISCVRKIIPEYKQDDPFVAADIISGNVIWKPKIEWDKLELAMSRE